MEHFKARLEIIDMNPFVFVPPEILQRIFDQAGKDKSPIPVRGSVNNKKYIQTLVKFRGAWRLYINIKMLKNSPKRIGEVIEVFIQYDPQDRTIKPHPDFIKALNENADAKKVFASLTPSLQKEIIRYISFLKTEESINRNIRKAIGFLLGKNRFVGRDHP
ncbi:MAG: YdeI/OmpD-associated family protein [Saprospiraceae bacterium]|nr:YdeI/OmpD-associated family protein [Saprospiraceae bacterium]